MELNELPESGKIINSALITLMFVYTKSQKNKKIKYGQSWPTEKVLCSAITTGRPGKFETFLESCL